METPKTFEEWYYHDPSVPQLTGKQARAAWDAATAACEARHAEDLRVLGPVLEEIRTIADGFEGIATDGLKVEIVVSRIGSLTLGQLRAVAARFPE